MSATYEVERGQHPDPDVDSLRAACGWAHLHALHRMLAAEEHVDLPEMDGYGGRRAWSSVQTPLRPLFDSDAFVDDRLPAAQCRAMLPRLARIAEKWSAGDFAATDIENGMRLDQNRSLRQLLAVIEACVRTGRALVVR